MYKDELICDLLEIYHIWDYHGVPVKMLCTLCSGLGPDTRIGMKLSGRKVPINNILMALIVDYLAGESEGYKRIAPTFYESKDEEEQEAFYSAEEYEEARRRILSGE